MTDTNETATASAWPAIPRNEIAKGNTITAIRLIELGFITDDYDSPKNAFRLLRLRDELMQRSVLEKEPISVRILKGGIHINTDAEASQYHHSRGENGIQMVRRQVYALAHIVDVAKLSSAEQQAHDRKLCVWGARMAALKNITLSIAKAL